MLARQEGWHRILAGLIAGGAAVGLAFGATDSLGWALFTGGSAGLILATAGGGWEGLLAQSAAIVVGWIVVADLRYDGQYAMLGIVAQGIPATLAFGVGWLVRRLGSRHSGDAA